MTNQDKLAEAIADREHWERIGSALELGRLWGWSYRSSASFMHPSGRTISVDGVLSEILPRLASAASRAELTRAEQDVLAERAKQRAKWGDAHDDEHNNDELCEEAVNLIFDPYNEFPGEWGLKGKHPNRRDQLVIGAALVLAEIDRIDRAAALRPADEGKGDERG